MGQPQSTGKGGQDGARHRFSCVCTPIQPYKEHFGPVKLAKSHVTLTTYNGQKITPTRER